MTPCAASRLLMQVLDGKVRQHQFEPAELELLLEIVEHPELSKQTLRRYQQTLARYAANGKSSMPSLSEYLEDHQRRRRSKRAVRSLAAGV